MKKPGVMLEASPQGISQQLGQQAILRLRFAFEFLCSLHQVHLPLKLMNNRIKPKELKLHPTITSFIHYGHFYSAPSNPLPLRGAPDCSTGTVSEFQAEAQRQLQVKVHTWRLERESSPRPSG